MSVFAILNPAAGRGRRKRRMEEFRALLRREIPDLVEAVTQHPGHEAELVQRALAEGHDRVVAVGGDGTASLVAHHLLASGRGDVKFGLLPTGTGNDFGKTVGAVVERAEEVVRAIASGRGRRVDVGRVGDRYFLNVVGAGFDIAVIDDAARTPLLRGDALYQFCALRQLFRFSGLELEIGVDGARPFCIDHLMLVIANANFFGGSFHIAPDARLDDGKLDAVCIGNSGPLARARLFSLVAKGRHLGHSKVRIERARSFRVGFQGVLRYEVDGEVLSSEGGALEVESVPGALDVLVPGS